jgi:hypothetical protein
MSIPDDESLDGLILLDGLCSRGAAHTVDVASAVLVTAVVPSLHSHDLVVCSDNFDERPSRPHILI